MCLHLSIFFVLQCFEFCLAVLWTRPACFWIFASALLGFLFEVIRALCSTQHTFTDAHPIPEDLCSVLRESELLKWNGTQLSLNQAEEESINTQCARESPQIQTVQFVKNQYFFLFLFSSNWINLPVHFHLTGFDLSFNGKPGKSDSHLLYSIMCLFLPLCVSDHSVNSVVMVLHLQVSKVWPNGDPVLVSVQSIQGPLLVHSQLNVAELSAFRHQLDLYTVTRDLSGAFLSKHSS